MNELVQNLRLALRAVRRSPLTVLAVVATLGLGLGSAAAIHSVVDALLLRPLPFERPDELVRVWSSQPDAGRRYVEMSGEDFLDLRREARSFAALGAFSEAERDLDDEAGGARRVAIARVTPGFFELLGVAPALGRGLEEGDEVVLGHALWQTRYGGDDEVLGRVVRLRGALHTIVGVLPAGFRYPLRAELWRPLSSEQLADDDRELNVVGRLARGVDARTAGAEVATIAARLAQARPASNAGISGWVEPLDEMVVRDVAAPLLLLLGGAGLLLVVTIVNVAALMLARSAGRRRELAVRAALGAGRGRLIRQLVGESVLLTLLGGAAGLLLGDTLLKGLLALSPYHLPLLVDVTLGTRTAVLVVGVALLAGLACGLAPTLRLARLDSGGLRTAADRRAQRGRALLVGAEVALATLLLVFAGLLSASFSRLLAIDRGFAVDGVVTAELTAPRGLEPAQQADLLEQVRQSIAGLPGVAAATLAQRSPLDPSGLRIPFAIEGGIGDGVDQRPKAVLRPVTPGYFAALDITVEGRPFDQRDAAGATGVAIVNRAFVRAFLGGSESSTIGRRLDKPAWWGEAEPFADTIVGIAADSRPELGVEAPPTIFFPFAQTPFARMTLLVRAADGERRLLADLPPRVWQIDRGIAVGEVRTLRNRLVESVAAGPRFLMHLLGVFAGLALVLATLGLYALVANGVEQRRREIGIRQALGATRRRVLRRVVGRGLALSAAGVAFGLAAAFYGAGMLRGLLYGVAAADPRIYAAAALVLLAVAGLASYLPARRAARVDPASALRVD